MIPLIVITLFGTFACLSVAALRPRKASVMATRIQDFRNRTVSPQQEFGPDLELAFADRVLKPSVESIARLLGRILPKSVVADVERQLMLGGNPMKLNTYLAFWALSMVMFGGIAVIMLYALPGSMLVQKVIGASLLTFIGYAIPKSYLKAKVKTKQKLVLKALPDSMDLITTCVEAGLGLDAALQRVADKGEGPFSEELQKMLHDVAMGKLRREAMSELSERIGVDELTNFVNSIIQAEQLGVGIAQVLRVQSDQLRTARRQRAERMAHEAPIKMLFPLVLFVFPAFLAIILGPAAIRIVQAF